MAQVPIHGVPILSQRLAQSQIHVYLGKELTFTNTIIMQAKKLISPNLAPIIHEHPYPQNALHSCPFAIINAKYPKGKDQIYKLLLVLIQVSDFAIHHPGEDYNYQSTEMGFALKALLRMCQELADVSTIINQDQINPFFVFLNPQLKYRQNAKMEGLKKRISINSQFLNKFGELNIDYFIHKLNILEAFMVDLQRKRKSLTQAKFIKICIIALLKHFSANSNKMLSAALELQTLKTIYSNMIQTLTDLSDFYERAVQEKRQVATYYSNFIINEDNQRKPIEVEPFRESLARALVKPIAVTLVVATLYRIFSD